MELIQKHVGTDYSAVDGFENQIQQEYLKYTAVADIVDDPLVWWKTHQAALPYLSALATEHHFSETGYFVNKKKANLNPLTLEMVMFIHDNFNHISASI